MMVLYWTRRRCAAGTLRAQQERKRWVFGGGLGVIFLFLGVGGAGGTWGGRKGGKGGVLGGGLGFFFFFWGGGGGARGGCSYAVCVRFEPVHHRALRHSVNSIN